MSASKWAMEFFRTIRSLTYGIFGWAVICPLSMAIPKKPDHIAVIGRYDGEFADNAKFFFLQYGNLPEKAGSIAFITERKSVENSLTKLGLRVYRYPTLQSLVYLAQASVVIVDSNEWAKKFRYFLTRGARIIQLWHGVGFKRIQLNKIENEVATKSWLSLPFVVGLRKIIHLVTGKRIAYDLLVTTSTFYLENVFKPSFLSRNFLVAGYPRNTFGEDLLDCDALWIGADKELYARCAEWKRLRKKIVLIAPTFRDSGKHPMALDPETVAALDMACEEHGYEFLFKFHPYEKHANKISGKHLHVVRADSDAYPLFPLTSALITDYSSIYMDYLLVDKPVLFFVPDLDEYIKNDRQFQFDYGSMTPGPKFDSWPDVMAYLLRSSKEDAYSAERLNMRILAFDGLDQSLATSKVVAFMRSSGWVTE
jgi:hypothetical protein